MADVIYTQAQLPVCKQHAFCEREHMQEEVQPEEDSTLPKQERWYITGSVFDKGSKISKEQKQDFIENYQAYIKKDFYQRNIVEKKRKLAEGLITEQEFQDDGVEIYQVVKLKADGANPHHISSQKAAEEFQKSADCIDWIEQSSKLSAKVWDERVKREKKEAEKKRLKLQANQSNQGNQALPAQATATDILKQSLTGIPQ